MKADLLLFKAVATWRRRGDAVCVSNRGSMMAYDLIDRWEWEGGALNRDAGGAAGPQQRKRPSPDQSVPDSTSPRQESTRPAGCWPVARIALILAAAGGFLVAALVGRRRH